MFQSVVFDHLESATVISAPPMPNVTIDATNGADAITIIARDVSTHAGTDGIKDFTVSVNATPQIVYPGILFINADTLTSMHSPEAIEITFALRHRIRPNGMSTSPSTAVPPPTDGDQLIIETPGQDTVVYTPGATPDSGSLLIDEAVNDSTITINEIEDLIYDGEAGNDTLTVVAHRRESIRSSTPPGASSMTEPCASTIPWPSSSNNWEQPAR